MESTTYYLFIDGARSGPYKKDQLLDVGLTRDTLVWFEECGDWQPVRDVPELARLLADARSGLVPIEPSPNRGTRYPESYLLRSYRFAMLMYRFMIIAFVVSGLCRFLNYALQNNNSRRREADEPTLLQIAALGSSAVGCILISACLIGFLVFLYRAWGIVQDGHTKVSPAKSVGFLFIPVFQYWWVFVSIAGLPRALNRFADRHQLIAPRASVLLGLTLCIYFVLAPIPYLGTALAVLNLLLLPLYMSSILQTASCFCQGNERFTADDTPVEGPMATRVAWCAGLAAIVLPIVAAGLGLVGYVGVVVSHNDLRIKEKALGEKLMEAGQLIARRPMQKIPEDLKRKAHQLQEKPLAEMNEAEMWVKLFVGVIAAGVGAFFLAIILAIIARRSNATLDQALSGSRHPYSEPAAD